MDRRDMERRRYEGYHQGSSGHSYQMEWDDEGVDEGGASFFGPDSTVKNDPRRVHMTPDMYGYGNRTRNFAKHLDNQKGHFGKGPKGYQRSNGRIYEDVCEALTRCGSVDASQIDVRVEDGIVTLSGTVESRRMKKEAEHVVDMVSGVDDVVNLLSLQGERKGDQIKTENSPLGDSTTKLGEARDK